MTLLFLDQILGYLSEKILGKKLKSLPGYATIANDERLTKEIIGEREVYVGKFRS